MEWFGLRTEIDRIVAEFAEDIASKRATVRVRADETRIFSSRVLFSQILANLLGNALKFVRPGEPPQVEIDARVSEQGVRITVRDHGIGIDLAYREKIFKVFEKLHQSAFPGTGIGLAIVQKAVERLGGKISVDSESGKGTCFTVDLPPAPPPLS